MPATKNGGTASTSQKAFQTTPFDTALSALNALPGSSLGLQSVTTLTQLNAHMMMRMLDINRQYLDFIGRRLDMDIAFSERLSKGTVPGDMFEHLTSFYQTAFEDYAQETAELLKNSTDATNEAIFEAEGEASRPLDKN